MIKFLNLTLLLFCLLLITSCSYNYYYVEKWDGAFAIDSVTIGALKRSYHEKRAGGDFGDTEYRDAKAQIFYYDIETGKLTEGAIITRDLSSGFNNTLISSYPYCAIIVEKSGGIPLTYWHDINTGEVKNIWSENSWLWCISDSGKYVAINTKSGKKVVNVKSEEVLDIGYDLLPIYIDEVNEFLYCVNRIGSYDFYGDTLYKLNIITGTKSVICDSIEGHPTHMFFSSNNEILLIAWPNEQLRFINKEVFLENPDTLKNISDFDTLDSRIGNERFECSYSLNNNIFTKIEDENVYYTHMNKPDTLRLILEDLEKEE